MAHSNPIYCGLCGDQWRPSRDGKGGNRKFHLDTCTHTVGCKCPPLHSACEALMRPDRPHHPPKDRSPIEESLPNKSTIVTHRAANGKPLSLIARIPVPAKGSATAHRETVQNRSKLLETVFERVTVPPTKQFKTAGEPDRVAQLMHLFKRDFLGGAFTAAATQLGVGNRQLTTNEQLELKKLLKISTVKWRNIKSYLLSKGIMALAGNERFLREEIDEMAARYEAGTTARGIHYYRCTNIVAELKEFVQEKAVTRLLTRRIGVTNDALRVTVLIDKGGGYTKAFITVWDVENGMSPTNAVFLGMYEGKDDHDSVYAVFGDALRSLELAAAGINWPYQYGDEKAVTNDDSVKAFFNHPVVKHDIARTFVRRRLNHVCVSAADVHSRMFRLRFTDNPAGSKPLFPVPYLSSDCERCAALKSAGVVSPSIRTTPYRSIRIAWGGDIPLLHELLGTNGHNGTYPCHVCLIRKNKLRTDGVPPANPPPLRTRAATAKLLIESRTGPIKSRKERARSQVYEAIPTTEYRGNVSLSPLHVTLGLVKDLMDELLRKAAELDDNLIRRRVCFAASANRCIPPVAELLTLYHTEQSLQREIDDLQQEIDSDRIKLKRTGGSVRRYSDRIAAAELTIKAKSILLAEAEAKLASDKTVGPFTRLLRYRLDEVCVTPRAWFSECYIGRDCERIMKHGGTLSGTIRRQQMIDINGRTEERGDDALAQKYSVLFAKLFECFRLYSAARPLCSHELQLLEIRSAELVPIWPRQFTPKFHLLTYHMPQFARDWLSVGLSTEQCVEAAHPIVNDLVRTCHGIPTPVKKLRSIGKEFLLQSAASVADYAPPHRICPQCNLPIATTALLHCQCSKPRISP